MRHLNKFLLPVVTLILSAWCFSCTQSNSTETLTAEVPVKEWAPEDTRNLPGLDVKRGLIINTPEATPGYILFHNGGGTANSTYLMNLEGTIVHEWKGDLPVFNSYLQDDGRVFRLERDPDFPVFDGGGQAGRIREYSWDGELLWNFEYATEQYLTHHDFAIMPNGNILSIAWESKSKEEAIAAGRNPELTPAAGLWPDKIVEIEPIRPDGGNIVWEWRLWDHLVQDFDSSKDNYGIIADHPRKININAHAHAPAMTEEQVEAMKKQGMLTSNATPDNQGSDMTHVNAIAYNHELDQIVISSAAFGEIWIIDHGTSTVEAKENTGGRWGHGGDLLYRWGNPANYDRGGPEDQKLFGQHDAKWIEPGFPGAGNLMVFNNEITPPRSKFPSGFAAMGSKESIDISIADLSNYSAVYEFVPPVDENGIYVLEAGGVFGPLDPLWSYVALDTYSLYSPFVSGAHRLMNGNTFITSGGRGRSFEVNPEGDIVWEYWNPFYEDNRLPDGTLAQPSGPFVFWQFRVTHISVDHPALVGKTLEPIDPQPEVFVPKPPPNEN